MESAVTILSTKLLPAGLWQPLQLQGIEVVQHDFIEVVPNPLERWVPILKDYLAQGKGEKNILITGKHGVAALRTFRHLFGDSLIEKAIYYCVGSQTASLMKLLRFHVEQHAPSATQLCSLLPVGSMHWMYMGGNLSTGVIEDFFNQLKYPLQKLEVYTTEHTPVQIVQQYSGILFGSPSAVQSFFAKNDWAQGIVAFAIGATTAAALHGRGVQAVHQPAEPGWSALVQCCADYFSAGKN